MTVLLPVLQVMLIIGVGFYFKKKRDFDLSTLSAVGLYIFIPALMFKGMYQSDFNFREMSYLFFVYSFVLCSLLVVAMVAGRILRLPDHMKSAFNLSCIIPNVGTLGIPLVVFALGGEAASAMSVNMYVIAGIFFSTIGTYVASRGTLNWVDTIKRMRKLPLIYAVFVALLLNSLHLEVPEFIISPILLMAGAALPIMLILLGGQFSNIQKISNLRVILTASGIRLVLTPVLAYVLINYVFHLPPGLNNVFLLQISTPTGINTTISALEFGSDAELTAHITLVSTLCSAITIPILLKILL